ncbi:MAG: 4Fe-4S binding protein [Bacteroidales bacterium]|nr:4Fe-4S binding protein [Bacteroidales bacterium]
MYKKLRIIRITVSLTVLLLLTAGLCGLGGWVGFVAGRLSALQLVGAVLGGCLTWIAFWLIVTLTCGRVYCSTVCPAGTCMDIVSRLRARRLKGPMTHFSAAPGFPYLRLLALAVFVEAVALGSATLTGWLDPYADFARLFAVWGAVTASGVVAAAMVIVVGTVTAWRSGRLLCNSICPVGAALGGISTVALMGFDINPDLCVHCGACERTCKSRCINSDLSLVDNSRCVVCFDCVAVCPNSAIRWSSSRTRLQWPLMMRTRTTAQAGGPTETSAPGAVDTCNKISTTEKTSTK